MADKTIMERLQPSLLDRLTDHEPGARSESRALRVIDIRRLREIIRRDLSWLLNTSDMGSMLDARAFPHTACSVLNYGLPEVAGSYSTAGRVDRIQKTIRTAIERFEPRINPGTLDVVQRSSENGSGATILFDIVADMWAEPMPLELYLRSEIDLTTGHVELEHRA
ncbi:type VI secretion system baseplate subunit TssE [Rhodosalinus sp.]|uniref:type VI secretion system baseplate subunit TssE n=1 Tax=Rhodosalinus sp. TaxID=2047741 RepID=UPI00397CEF99